MWHKQSPGHPRARLLAKKFSSLARRPARSSVDSSQSSSLNVLMARHEYRVETLGDAYEYGHRLWGFCARCGWTRAYHPNEISRKHGREARLRDVQIRGTCPRCGWTGDAGGFYLVPEPRPTLTAIPADKRWWNDKPKMGPDAIVIKAIGDLSVEAYVSPHCKNDGCRYSGRLDLLALARFYGPDVPIDSVHRALYCPACRKAGRPDKNIGIIIGHKGGRDPRDLRDVLKGVEALD